MLDSSARLLRLLGLLQARRYWTGTDLAERLEVTVRSLRRDMRKLRELGYPVESSAGPAGGYSLGAGTSLPPLLLDDDEVLAVVLGLRLAATGALAGMEEKGLMALAKLEQLLPARLRKRAQALHAAVAPLSMGGPAVDMARLSTLAAACRDGVQVSFGYQSKDGRSSERQVEPHSLVCTGSRWYLLAWDLDRGDWRTFRVDRSSGRVRCGGRFLPRPVPGGDPAAYVSRSISTLQYPLRARILLHAPLQEMARCIPPLAGRLEHVDEERCLLETGAYSPQLVAAHLAAFDVGFEVLEPPEVIAQIAEMATRLSRAGTVSRARRRAQ